MCNRKDCGCKNNLETSSTAKAKEHIPSGLLMFTMSSFKSIEKKHDAYRSKDCIKKFFESLREHAIKKKMKLLRKKQQ